MKTDELLKALSTQNIDDVLVEVADYDFVSYLAFLVKKAGIKNSMLFEKAQIERSYGYQILKGSRVPSRDKVIALAFALSLDLDETNRLLKLADHGTLYANVKRDAVIIYCLIRHYSLIETNEVLSSYHYSILTEERG